MAACIRLSVGPLSPICPRRAAALLTCRRLPHALCCHVAASQQTRRSAACTLRQLAPTAAGQRRHPARSPSLPLSALSPLALCSPGVDGLVPPRSRHSVALHASVHQGAAAAVECARKRATDADRIRQSGGAARHRRPQRRAVHGQSEHRRVRAVQLETEGILRSVRNGFRKDTVRAQMHTRTLART